MNEMRSWKEIYDGGSPEAEHASFLSLAADLLRVQEANRRNSGASRPARTLHAKLVAAVTNASLVIDRTLSAGVAAGYFQPGTSLPATIRLSNASGVPQHDSVPDMRGAAVRISLPNEDVHDLLMTNFPASHARNARQFVAFAVIASGDRETLLARLIEAVGAAEAQRMVAAIRLGARPCSSLALERFGVAGPFFGEKLPCGFNSARWTLPRNLTFFRMVPTLCAWIWLKD